MQRWLICEYLVWFWAFCGSSWASVSYSKYKNGHGGNETNPEVIRDWNPVYASILKGQKDYYKFPINASNSNAFVLQGYELFIFLSGNICKYPKNPGTNMTLSIFYSFSWPMNASNAQYSIFSDGYMEALAVMPYTSGDLSSSSSSSSSTSNSTANSTLYMSVQLINNYTGQPYELDGDDDPEQDAWLYQLAVSQSDLAYQWDKRQWLDVVDTDYNSALLVSGNISLANLNWDTQYSISNMSFYDVYVYESQYENYFDEMGLTKSLCAIKNGPYLVSSVNSTYDPKVSENVSLSITDLGAYKSLTKRNGNLREQFHITGLNGSTTYVAFLTKKLASTSSESLSADSGVVFAKQKFTTMSDPSCTLIFGLGFCDGLAYSVPSSSLLKYEDKSELANVYDSIVESFYSNFSLAMQMITCDALEDELYSPLRSCDDCKVAYKDWLCSVSIPRCTTTKTDYYIYRSASESRNDKLDELIKPASDYYEILPCIDTCVTMQRDCPPDFGFSCPPYRTYRDLMLNSYNFFHPNETFLTCNFIGNTSDLVVKDPTMKY